MLCDNVHMDSHDMLDSGRRARLQGILLMLASPSGVQLCAGMPGSFPWLESPSRLYKGRVQHCQTPMESGNGELSFQSSALGTALIYRSESDIMVADILRKDPGSNTR